MARGHCGDERRDSAEHDQSYEDAVRSRHRVLVELSETFAVLVRVDLAAGEALAEDPPRRVS